MELSPRVFSSSVAAAVLHAATGGSRRRLLEGGDRTQRAEWRLFGLYVQTKKVLSQLPHQGKIRPEHIESPQTRQNWKHVLGVAQLLTQGTSPRVGVLYFRVPPDL